MHSFATDSTYKVIEILSDFFRFLCVKVIVPERDSYAMGKRRESVASSKHARQDQVRAVPRRQRRREVLTPRRSSAVSEELWDTL